MSDLELWGSVPWAIVGVGVLALAAYGTGSLVINIWENKTYDSFDGVLIRLACGLNLIAIAGLVLGMGGGLSFVLHLCLLALAAWGAWSVFPFRRLLMTGPRRARARGLARDKARGRALPRGAAGLAQDLHRHAWLLSLPVIGGVAITLGPALCYPTGWDELVYHHELPRRWVQAGALEVFRDLPYSGFPASGEILFWILTPWDYPIAPRLLIWLCWACGLGGIYRLVARHAGRGTALAVVCAAALNDSVLLISANCYVESLQMLNGVALLLMVQAAGRRTWSGGARWTLAAGLGILSGGAAAVKLTGVAWLAVPILWYGSRLLTCRLLWRRAIAESALAVAVALAMCAPFYLRPWLATGNPFYPYWANWFTQDAAPLEVSRHHHLIGGIGFGVPDSGSFLTAPILLAFRADNYDGEFGWQFLVLLFLAILAISSWRQRRMRVRLLWPLGLSVWLYLFWFLTSQQARFAIPGLAAVLLVAALGLRLLSRRAKLVVSGLLMMASLVSVPWHRAGYYAASWLTVAGVMSRTDYIHNLTDLAYLPLVQALQAKTPPQSRVMLLFEHRGYYVPRAHQIGTPLFQEGPFTPPEQYGTSAAILVALQADSISHIVLAKGPVGPDQAPGWYERQAPLLRGIEQAVGEGLLRVVWESEFYVVLAVAGQG